jgi:hypothetical protein
MLFQRTTFIGIDPTAGEKPFTYAALDHELRLLALGHGSIDDVLAFTAGQRQAAVAVCAPRRPNQGCMAQAEVRAGLTPQPNPGRWENFRVADYMLRRYNFSMPQTPSDESRAPNWMRSGFTLFRRLDRLGYKPFPGDEAELYSLEVYPYACFAVLIGARPLPKYTLEGRLQRQLVLHDNKLEVPDPMDFFEEVTRYRLMKGILPLDSLYTSGELDALAAAYTAWMSVVHPERVTALGDPLEGQVVLPAADLKSHYG